jgi:NAD(P)-dependent dehydrogenase (short-subunit alcohol dehydrogenase family)
MEVRGKTKVSPRNVFFAKWGSTQLGIKNNRSLTEEHLKTTTTIAKFVNPFTTRLVCKITIIMHRLKDKVAIVTGASSGIGRAIALAFHREGAVVICGDLREKARDEILAETDITTHDLITQEGGTAEFLKVDVTKAEDQERLVARAVEKHGRLDM